MIIFGIFLFIGLAHAQPHAQDGVSCYNCHGGHAHENFPECLNHVHYCHHDEACQINYGGPRTEIKCRPRQDCTRDVDHAPRQCSTGGASVHDSCQICCQDDGCTSNAMSMVNVNGINVAQAVHCPADCALDNLANCLNTGHVCTGDEYCKISRDETNNHMHGKCERLPDLQHCQAEVAAAHCDPRHHNCVVGCCTNDSCISGAFGATNTDFLSILQGNCQDQLIQNQCLALENSQHVCQDKLALRLCPDTCGLCQLYQANQCQDTVVNRGCAGMVSSENICANPLAIHICPVTCNLCDNLIQELINQALANGTVMVPTSTIPPDTTPLSLEITTPFMTQPPISTAPPLIDTLTCTDLDGQTCSVLSALCLHLSEACPDHCGSPCSGGVDLGGGSTLPDFLFTTTELNTLFMDATTTVETMSSTQVNTDISRPWITALPSSENPDTVETVLPNQESTGFTDLWKTAQPSTEGNMNTEIIETVFPPLENTVIVETSQPPPKSTGFTDLWKTEQPSTEGVVNTDIVETMLPSDDLLMSTTFVPIRDSTISPRVTEMTSSLPCEDTIQGASCSNLPDVCNNPTIGIVYCRKYCNFC